jgi:glycosyltransferase involved in cell wall biosynthesis
MRVAIAGHFDTRGITAAGLRVRGMAEALSVAGHEVSVVDVRHGAGIEGGRWTIEAPRGKVPLPGISLDEYAGGFLSRFPRGVRGLFIGDVTADHIRRRSPPPDIVIVYGTPFGYVRHMRKLCRELGIPLILDVVEWYAAEDLPGGRLGPYAFSNMLSMRWKSLSADGFFVISERLARHYERTGKPVVIVPPLFAEPVENMVKWSADDGRLHLVYAGSPGKKEAFGTLLGGLDLAAAAGTALTLHLVGMTETDLRAIPGGSAWLDRPGASSTLCYGRVPNVRAKEIVSRSDFSVLLRPLRRSNQFGFPSKLAESMTLGTPVIANRFSDLSRFLRDGENALLLPDLSNESFADAVMRAANHSPGIRNMMCASAQALARTHFCPQSHARSMSDMLEKLRG